MRGTVAKRLRREAGADVKEPVLGDQVGFYDNRQWRRRQYRREGKHLFSHKGVQHRSPYGLMIMNRPYGKKAKMPVAGPPIRLKLGRTR